VAVAGEILGTCCCGTCSSEGAGGLTALRAGNLDTANVLSSALCTGGRALETRSPSKLIARRAAPRAKNARWFPFDANVTVGVLATLA
jgi:hypothetical protein